MAEEVGTKVLSQVLLIFLEKTPNGVTVDELVDSVSHLVTKKEVISSLKSLTDSGKIGLTAGKRIILAAAK